MSVPVTIAAGLALAAGQGKRLGTSLLSTLWTLLGLLAVTFLIGRAMPIDPALAIAGDKASAATVAQVRLELGLDKPLAVQLGIYLQHLVRGDLGTSVMTGNPVTQDLAHFFPATIELASSAMLIALLVGIPLGVWVATRPGSRVDHLARLICLLGQSVPVFVLALLSLLVFYVKLDISPGIGQQGALYQGTVPTITGMLVLDAALHGQWAAAADAGAHLCMPALLLAFVTVSVITRMTRALMLDALEAEYIITAHAKGLLPARVLWRHGFLSIAGRLAPVIALSYAGLLEGAVLTETVFSWSGIGFYLTRSLLNADMNAVLGATLIIAVAYLLLNRLADLAQRLLDPRVG